MSTKQFSNGAIYVAGISYQLKYNIRAIVLFEKMTDKPFTLQSIADWVIFLYCMLLSGTPEAAVTLDEFMDNISQEQLSQAAAWTTGQMENEVKAV